LSALEPWAPEVVPAAGLGGHADDVAAVQALQPADRVRGPFITGQGQLVERTLT
jgi:hypothetical protein